MAQDGWTSLDNDLTQADGVAGTFIIPLCVAVNQTFTRVAVGHEEGFLVFVVEADHAEVHDDMAYLFPEQDTAARTQARRAKPPLDRTRIDPRYNARPELFRNLERPSRTDATAESGEKQEIEEETVTVHDVLALSRQSLARQCARRRPSAPSDEERWSKPWVSTVREYARDEVHDEATPTTGGLIEGKEDVHPRRPSAPSAESTASSAPSSSSTLDTHSEEAALTRLAAGGVAVMALLYDYPQLAVVGGGPTPLGPADEVQLLRNGETVNCLRVPSATGERVENSDTPTPDRCIVQLEIDAGVLFVCTSRALFVFTEPDSPVNAACAFHFPFHACVVPTSPPFPVPPLSHSGVGIDCSPESVLVAHAVAAVQSHLRTDEADGEDTLNMLRRHVAQPVPPRPIHVDHAHGLLLVASSATVFHTDVFTRLVAASGSMASLCLTDPVSDPMPNSAKSGLDRTRDSICLFSYHVWSPQPSSPTSASTAATPTTPLASRQIDIRVRAARAHVARHDVSGLALHVGPLTSFSAAAVERACRAVAARMRGSATASSDTSTAVSSAVVEWRPAQTQGRALRDWRTVGGGHGAKQHLAASEAIVIATSSAQGTCVRLWCVSAVSTPAAMENAGPVGSAHITYAVIPFRDLRLGTRAPEWKRTSALLTSSSPVAGRVAEANAQAPTADSSASADGASGWRRWMQRTVAATVDAGAQLGFTRGPPRQPPAEGAAPLPSSASGADDRYGTTDAPEVMWRDEAALSAFDRDDARHRVYHLQFVDDAHFLVCVRDGTLQVFAVGEAEDDLSGLKQERLAARTATPGGASSAVAHAPLAAHELALARNGHSVSAGLWGAVGRLLPSAAQAYMTQQWAACTTRILPGLVTASPQGADREQRQLAQRAYARWMPLWLTVCKQDEKAARAVLAEFAAEAPTSTVMDADVSCAAALSSYPIVWGRAPRHLAACIALWERDRALPHARQAAARAGAAVSARSAERDGADETGENSHRMATWPVDPSAVPSSLWTEKVSGPLVPSTSVSLDVAQQHSAPWLCGGLSSKVVLTLVNCEGRLLTARIYTDTGEAVLSCAGPRHVSVGDEPMDKGARL